MSKVNEVPENPVPATTPANRFTPDAQERFERLRAMSDGFPDESDRRTLSTAEIRLARATSAAALENAAVFALVAPGIGNTVADVGELRDAIAFELAYAIVRDEARSLARNIDMAILRRKLKAVKAARGLYRIGKSFVTVDAGDSVRSHVTDMKRTLGRRRRSKNGASPPDPVTTAKK